jgi:propanol-preferring alcohol dehydrogenase
MCPRAQFTGYDVDGGFADYLIAAAEFVVPLPDALPDTAAAPLLCAGVIGFRPLRFAEVGRGARLGLFGFGASAHLTLQVAVRRGVRVYAFSRGEGHRRLAATLGAEWTGQAGDDPGHPLDAAIIFAPAGELVPTALETLDRGGRLVLAGIYMTPVPALEYHRLYQERSIQSVANATRQDAMEFMTAAAGGVLPQVEAFPLAAANQALQRLKAGALQGAGVLVMD